MFARNEVVSGQMRTLGSYDIYQKLAPELDFELREATIPWPVSKDR